MTNVVDETMKNNLSTQSVTGDFPMQRFSVAPMLDWTHF